MDLPQDLTGKTLKDRYQVERILGQGGMGAVFLSKDNHTDNPVAIKFLHPINLSTSPEPLLRFIQEGKILRELNHPNIVKVLETFEQDGNYYLVMEYISGGDLTSLINSRKPPDISKVLSIGLELADALTRAHHLNVLHRDLKPANVLLASGDSVRLTDFGIAHLEGQTRITKEATLMGTVEYLSPDVCLGQELDARADLWSFGVLLYELLLGKVPFAGNTPASMISAILHQKVPDIQVIRPEIPDGLADLIYRMLVKDRDGRIPSARLVGAELEGLLHGFEVTTSHRPAAINPAVEINGSQFAPPTPISTKIKINLPTQSTRFIGRQSELSELDRLLNQSETRLLTILGFGGMGKSRLGIEAARAQANLFKDGVYFIDLAPLSGTEQIPRAIAEPLGFTFGIEGSPEEQLIHHLRDKNLLLLADNFEHLTAGAPFLADILTAAPGIKILVTSRTQLNLQDERVFEIYGMHIPVGESPQDFEEVEAVELFVSSARRVRPDFHLTEEDKPVVGEICQIVEGMPLGILLAAAWVNVLQPEDILEELNSDIDFLTSRFQDTPDRQRSIRAAFNYSWRQLPVEHQEALKRLSVFRGGFIRPAALAVAGAGVRTLSELVERSMLQRTGSGRFHIHELTRQFAAEELAQEPEQETETRERHLEYYAEFLQSQDTKFSGDWAQIDDSLSSVSGEIDNCLAAWDWGVIQKRFPHINNMVNSLMTFFSWENWYGQAHSIAKKTAATLEITRSIAGERMQRILYWKLINWQVYFGYLTGFEDLKSWEKILEQIVEAAIDDGAIPELGAAFSRLVEFTSPTFQRSRALDVFPSAQDIFEKNDQLYELTFILDAEAWFQWRFMGNTDEARRLYEKSLKIATQINSDVKKGFIQEALGSLWMQIGDYQKAEQYFGSAYSIAKKSLKFGNVTWVMIIQRQRAVALEYLGEFDLARQLLEEASTALNEKKQNYFHISTLGLLANNLILTGYLKEAKKLLDEYTQYFQGNPGMLGLGRYSEGKLEYFQGDYATARNLLEESLLLFEKQYEHPESRDAAGSLSLLGEVERAAGERQIAWETLGEAVRICLKHMRVGDLMAACLALARWLRDEERFEEAVELSWMVANSQGTIHFDRERSRELLTELQPLLSSGAYSSARSMNKLLSPQDVYLRYWGDDFYQESDRR